jgi:hypothetical protein
VKTAVFFKKGNCPGRWDDKRQAKAAWQKAVLFLKKRTKKRLRIKARSIGKSRSQSNQRCFAAFFQKSRPSLPTPAWKDDAP